MTLLELGKYALELIKSKDTKGYDTIAQYFYYEHNYSIDDVLGAIIAYKNSINYDEE